MSKIWTAASALLASLAVGCIFGYLQTPPTTHGNQIKPFVVHQVERIFNEGKDQPVFASDQTFARRSDGSWSDSFTSREADGSYGHVLDYVDLARMVTVHTEPVTLSVMTWAISAADIPRDTAAGFRACNDLKTGYEAGPHSRILGYDVIFVSATYTGTGATEARWVAPALDCYALRSVYRTPAGGHDDFEVTAVQEVEPPAALFEVPSGYVERSPKAIQALYSEKIPGTVVFAKGQVESLERRYRAARPQ